MANQKINLVVSGLLFLSVLSFQASAQKQTHAQAEAEMMTAMKNSENDWNKGDLKSYMAMYIPSSTMMMASGPAGYSAIQDLYEKHYFSGGMPKQNLHYDDLKVTFLGDDYALLTGKFILTGNNLPERSGRYSLVMIHTKEGWKILHDHSS